MEGWSGSFSHQEHQRQKDRHLAWYRFGIYGVSGAHMVAAASLELPHLQKDLPRFFNQLGRVPGDRSTPTRPARGEDHRIPAATLSGPQCAAAPGDTILFESTTILDLMMRTEVIHLNIGVQNMNSSLREILGLRHHWIISRTFMPRLLDLPPPPISTLFR